MRLLVLTHNYPRRRGDPAGAFVARLARGARAAGHDVHVVAPHAPGTPRTACEDGVTVVRYRYAPDRLERVAYTGALHVRSLTSPMIALVLPLFLHAFRRAARREVAAVRPDLVHAHWWIPAGVIAAGAGVPFVVTCHGSDVRLLERVPALRVLARRVIARASAVTTVSHFLAHDLGRLLGVPESRIAITPMPIDTEHFATGIGVAKVDPARILYAGNLVPSKGVDVLVIAYARLRARGVRCSLEILGEGPEKPALQALASRLGVADAITWSPFVPQERMPEQYGASTVTVLPSRGRAEGLGLTLAEALLAGCAVVGTRVGGIPEVVVHEETGLLARDGDADDLAAQIERLLADGALRRRLTERGCERVRSIHGEAAAVARVLALYDEVRGRQDAA